jgi:hypothetical protein
MIITHLKNFNLKAVKLFALTAKDFQFYSICNFSTSRLNNNSPETSKKLNETPETHTNSIIQSYIKSDVSTNLRSNEKGI